jgi:hypothetical protein
MGAEGPASTSTRVVAVSAAFFAEAGVGALVDSKTTSNTLAILLLLRVIAEIWIPSATPALVAGSRFLVVLSAPPVLVL